MGRLVKLLDAASNNPSGLAFREFETMLRLCGWRMDRQSGSHRIWISPGGMRLPVQKRIKGKGVSGTTFADPGD